MTIPANVQAIIRQLWARFPPDQSSDDSRRAFMRKVNQQLGWSVSLAWGYYKTHGNNPPSADLLPYLEPGGTKHGWDIIVGGAGGLDLNGADYHDTTGTDGWVFHALTPINHLSEPSPPIPPTPDLEARVQELEAEQTVLREMLEALQARVAALPTPADPSDWEAAGKVLWWNVTLPLRRKT